jgi:hypothetical protein
MFSTVLLDISKCSDFVMEETAFLSHEHSDPVTFETSWNHEDKDERKKWREAIDKEMGDMKLRGVGQVIPRCNKPTNRRCVKHKWVFNTK